MYGMPSLSLYVIMYIHIMYAVASEQTSRSGRYNLSKRHMYCSGCHCVAVSERNNDYNFVKQTTSRSLSQQFLYIDDVNMEHGVVGNNIQQVFFASEGVCNPAHRVRLTRHGTVQKHTPMWTERPGVCCTISGSKGTMALTSYQFVIAMTME